MKAYRYASLARSVKELETKVGLIQIVELDNDGCVVGYRPKDGVHAGRWQHWGPGVGGYKATVKRFMTGPMFNPAWEPPKKQKRR